MGIRIRDKKANNSPSPGQYNPTYEVLKKSMPKFGMGSSSRYQDKNRDSAPGPGSYKRYKI